MSRSRDADAELVGRLFRLSEKNSATARRLRSVTRIAARDGFASGDILAGIVTNLRDQAEAIETIRRDLEGE